MNLWICLDSMIFLYKFDSKDNKTDTSSDGNDVFAQLEKLQKLKEAGILTDEEFNLKKQELLNKM